MFRFFFPLRSSIRICALTLCFISHHFRVVKSIMTNSWYIFLFNHIGLCVCLRVFYFVHSTKDKNLCSILISWLWPLCVNIHIQLNHCVVFTCAKVIALFWCQHYRNACRFFMHVLFVCFCRLSGKNRSSAEPFQFTNMGKRAIFRKTLNPRTKKKCWWKFEMKTIFFFTS